jgi:hypothetical protein
MNRYIEQLIEDFHKSRQIVNPPSNIWNGMDAADPGDVEDTAYAEEVIYGKKELVSEITGIEQNLLPPPRKLTNQQAAMLASEMELLLNHYNLYPDFPEGFPGHLRYPMLRKLWKKKHVAVSFGENHIEFCNYDESKCPFPGYCNTCEEFRSGMDIGAKAGDLFEDLDAADLLNFDPNDL